MTHPPVVPTARSFWTLRLPDRTASTSVAITGTPIYQAFVKLSGNNNGFSGGHLASNGTGVLEIHGSITSSVPVVISEGFITRSGGGSYTALSVGADTTRIVATNGISTSATVDVAANDVAILDLDGFDQQIAATGATLDMTFAGTDTVDKLFIGGFQQAAGIQEASGNPGSGTEIAQITGTLTVTSSPAGGTFNSWASANGATGRDPDMDHDNDGVENGIEYFMGQTGSTITSLPVPDANRKVAWIKDPADSGTFAVQTSSELSTWTTQTHTVNGNLIEYTLPTSQVKIFVRLIADPNGSERATIQ